MSKMKRPQPVLRLASCLTADRMLVEEARLLLVKEYGPVEIVSKPFPFDFTDYYEEETGKNINRYWLVFEELMEPDELIEFRHHTDKVEARFAIEGNRKVNIDPGYLDFGKLVLASLKEGADKIYLGRYVWAHSCLRFCNGGFVAPDHSFPDFKQEIFNDFFLMLRGYYKDRLRCLPSV